MTQMSLVLHARRLAKITLARAFFHSGLLHVYRLLTMKHAAVVLLYHRVVEEPTDLPDYAPAGMTVLREHFEAQMEYVRRQFQPVTLAELARRLAAPESLGGRLCAVTFDDGWRDNYTHAFPVLRRYRIPATIFLATNFVSGGPWFWEERLKYLLAHFLQAHRAGQMGGSERTRLRDLFGEAGFADLLEQPLPEFRVALSALVTTLRGGSPQARDRLLEALEQLLDAPGLAEPRRFMSWQEIREMETAGVAFGCHTASHVNLERCDLSTAETEIRCSLEASRAALEAPLPMLAYPFGKSTPSVRALAARTGTCAAFTTRPGLVRKGDDLHALNRVDIHDGVAATLPLFASRASHLLRMY